MKDARGVIIKVGSTILFNGILMVVERIEDNKIITGTYKTDPHGRKIIPGKIICSCGIECNTLMPVNCFVLSDGDNKEEDKKDKEQQRLAQA